MQCLSKTVDFGSGRNESVSRLDPAGRGGQMPEPQWPGFGTPYAFCRNNLHSARPQMVDFGSEQGLSEFETLKDIYAHDHVCL